MRTLAVGIEAVLAKNYASSGAGTACTALRETLVTLVRGRESKPPTSACRCILMHVSSVLGDFVVVEEEEAWVGCEGVPSGGCISFGVMILPTLGSGMMLGTADAPLRTSTLNTYQSRAVNNFFAPRTPAVVCRRRSVEGVAGSHREASQDRRGSSLASGDECQCASVRAACRAAVLERDASSRVLCRPGHGPGGSNNPRTGSECGAGGRCCRAREAISSGGCCSCREGGYGGGRTTGCMRQRGGRSSCCWLRGGHYCTGKHWRGGGRRWNRCWHRGGFP